MTRVENLWLMHGTALDLLLCLLLVDRNVNRVARVLGPVAVLEDKLVPD